MREDCRGAIFPQLPDDLAFECLTRLRLWDLPAARCVSASWRAVLASDEFARTRRSLAATRWRARSRSLQHGEEYKALMPGGATGEDAGWGTHEEWLCVCGSSKKWPGRLQWFAYDPEEREEEIHRCTCAAELPLQDADVNSNGTMAPVEASSRQDNTCRDVCRKQCRRGRHESSAARVNECLSGRSKPGTRWHALPPLPPSNAHGSTRCNGFSAAAVPGLGIAVAGGAGGRSTTLSSCLVWTPCWWRRLGICSSRGGRLPLRCSNISTAHGADGRQGHGSSSSNGSSSSSSSSRRK